MNGVNSPTGVMCFVLVQAFVAALNCTDPSPESLFHAFEKELFPRKFIRPVKSFAHSTNVTLRLTLVAILGVNEKAQTLSMLMWKTLATELQRITDFYDIQEWDIEWLNWDEKECGAHRVSVPRGMLWVPDIIITEFMAENEGPVIPYVYLDNTGHVYDDQPLKVVSSCRLEIYYFPFDIQNCSLTFGPFLHIARDVRISEAISAEEVLQGSREVMYTEGEWELANITLAQHVLEFEGASYSEIKYYIILRRRPILYVVNLLVPSVFLVTVDLLSFLLPPQNVDRSSFKMTLILGYTVFLLLMNDLLPVTGNAIPLINVFFSVSLALMVASLLETVLITTIQFGSSEHSAAPRWLRVLLLNYLAPVVCLPRQTKANRVTVWLQPQAAVKNDSVHLSAKDLQLMSEQKETSSSAQDPLISELRSLSRDISAIRRQVDEHIRGTNNNKEWHMLGMVIDRLLFGLYIVFIMVSFITITCIWTINSSYSN